MQLTGKTLGLAVLSLFTSAFTATSLLHAGAHERPAPAPAVQVAHREPTPVPVPVRKILPPLATRTAVPPENPTALEVAGNPHRFIGSHVHWTCVVDLVPEPTFADANCGPPVPSFVQPPLSGEQMQNDPDAVAQSIRLAQGSLHGALRSLRKRAMIVLTGPVGNLDHAETIVIDGTVRRPLRGENAFGVTRAFPTVRIDTIVASRASLP